MYTCTVCGEQYEDTFKHILEQTKLGNWVPTKAHAERFKELETGMHPKVKRCFCGGTVSTIPSGSDGWSTDCDDCQMMYDED